MYLPLQKNIYNKKSIAVLIIVNLFAVQEDNCVEYTYPKCVSLTNCNNTKRATKSCQHLYRIKKKKIFLDVFHT